jgi:hypothetical protein
MNRTANNSNFWRTVIQVAALTWLASACVGLGLAQSNASNQPTGVRNSCGPQRLSANQLQMIAQSLRQKSGFAELGFDAQGALTLGNRNHVAGGSAAARALLAAAVVSPNLYELESHESSPHVAFARILETEDKEIGEPGKRMTISQVQLDFADFDRLSGAREARESFEIGIALLHELVHGVLKLKDPSELNQIGECDAHVNQMRRELHLPERLYYYPNISVVQISNGQRVVSASLEFVEHHAQSKAKYRLSWQANQVSPNARNIAQLQQGLVTPKRH